MADAVSTVGSGASTGSVQRNALSDLSSDQFFKIIFAELNNQDPLAPSDSKALMEQLSTLRSMQSDMDLSRDLRTIVARDEMASAANLLGRQVTGLSDSGRRATGEVKSILRTSDGAILALKDGTRLPMSGLEEVLSAAPTSSGDSTSQGETP